MSENIMYLNEESFKAEVLDANKLVLVDFYADWCSPCRMLTPILEALSESVSDKAKIAKLNVDEARKTAADFRISSIPCMIFFKDGKEVERLVGLRDKEEIQGIVDRLA